MKRPRLRVLGALITVATGLGGAALLPTAPAQAATTYTWIAGWNGDGTTVPGADHRSWGNEKNWSPAGVPGPSDTVLLTNAPAYNGVQSSTELEVPPSGVTVASLAITQPGAGSVRLLDGPVGVTDSFEWTGGEVHSQITLAASAAGTIGAGQLKPLHAKLTVHGSLLLDDIGAAGDSKLQLYPDYDGDDDGIAVTSGGTLEARGANLVEGTGCCADPARIVSEGAIDVQSGHTTLRAVEVDLLGTVSVAPTARLTQTTGPARLGAGTSYRGGGTIEFVDTASIGADPASEPVPGGVLMQGMGQLADDTRLTFGVGAKLTGVGGFDGLGRVEFDAVANDAHQSAVIYGDLKIGAQARALFAGAEPARLLVWHPDLSGYHGVLRLRGQATVQTGSSFNADAGTVTTVNAGGQLTLEPATTWGEGSCCTVPARLTVAEGGTLALSGGSGAPAQITRTDLRIQGTTSLAAGKRLVTEGYPVRVGGTLQVVGKTGAATRRTVVTGEQIKGHFDCVAPGDQVATYSATKIRVAGTLGKFSGCLKSLKKTVLSKKLAKHKRVRVAATAGVPKSAKKVLLAVTVTKPTKKAVLKIGGVKVAVPAKRTATRYVVAKRAKGKVAVANAGAAAVKVKVVLIGVPK